MDQRAYDFRDLIAIISPYRNGVFSVNKQKNLSSAAGQKQDRQDKQKNRIGRINKKTR
jgi:hypothetical protein